MVIETVDGEPGMDVGGVEVLLRIETETAIDSPPLPGFKVDDQ